MYHHRQKHHPEAENEPPKRYTTSATLQQNRDSREPSLQPEPESHNMAVYDEHARQAMASYAQLAQAASEEQFRNFLAAKERGIERPSFLGAHQK